MPVKINYNKKKYFSLFFFGLCRESRRTILSTVPYDECWLLFLVLFLFMTSFIYFCSHLSSSRSSSQPSTMSSSVAHLLSHWKSRGSSTVPNNRCKRAFWYPTKKMWKIFFCLLLSIWSYNYRKKKTWSRSTKIKMNQNSS